MNKLSVYLSHESYVIFIFFNLLTNFMIEHLGLSDNFCGFCSDGAPGIRTEMFHGSPQSPQENSPVRPLIRPCLLLYNFSLISYYNQII
jgi:hypothetical protein